jgi:hypothetical protein
MYVTVFPDTAHTPDPSAENTTGLPEPPPVAVKVPEPPTVPVAGAANEIDWGSAPTLIVRWTWGAAS